MSKQNNNQENKNSGKLSIQRIYLKDASFESPNAPESFQGQWKPEVHLELGNQTNHLDGHTYEVVLKLTVTVKNNKKIAFLCEAKQAGIFQLEDFSNENCQQLLSTYCPNTLFPYARESIGNLVSKGGFPQLVLAPVNFDALYAEAKRQQHEQKNQGQNSSNYKKPGLIH